MTGVGYGVDADEGLRAGERAEPRHDPERRDVCLIDDAAELAQQHDRDEQHHRDIERAGMGDAGETSRRARSHGVC